jgi:acyl carrier protein
MGKNDADVEKRFKAIVTDLMGVDAKKLKDSTRFVQDLHAKSIDIIALIAATEGEFGIKITPHEASQNTTVKKTIDCIKKELKAKR